MKNRYTTKGNIKEINYNCVLQIISCLIIFFVLFQFHKLVGLYHDDYGNISLSYGTTSENIAGSQFSIIDLLEYSKHLYLNWTGRVLYFFNYILIARIDFNAFMKVQSVLLATMFFAMSKTSKNLKYSWMFLILASLLFFTLPVNLFNHGIFWGAASSNYL